MLLFTLYWVTRLKSFFWRGLGFSALSTESQTSHWLCLEVSLYLWPKTVTKGHGHGQAG